MLVVGASGSLGYKICEAVQKFFADTIELCISDYQAVRGQKTAEKLAIEKNNFMAIDINDATSINAALSQNLNAVIVAVPQKDVLVQKICNNRKIPCVDVTAFKSFSEKLRQEIPNPETALIVMAGFFPGFCGVLVKSFKADFPEVDQVDAFLLQNKNANVGITGIHDMLTIISKPLVDGSRGFNNLSVETFANQSFKLREINHDEAQLLQEKLPLERVTYHTAWNSAPFNSIIHFVIKHNLTNFLIGCFRKLKINLDNQQPDETIYLKLRGTKGKNSQNNLHEMVLKFHSDYEMTAYCAAFMANYLTNENNLQGIFFPFEILDAADFHFLEINQENAIL
ncbi:saccharopine dehydrogenase NADP-binding domain-containing protein [Enterococcus sp. LJL90]